jgi:hypothetical protein
VIAARAALTEAVKAAQAKAPVPPESVLPVIEEVTEGADAGEEAEVASEVASEAGAANEEGAASEVASEAGAEEADGE